VADILAALERARRILGGRDFPGREDDPAVHDAVIYNLLVASEAASRLRNEWLDFSEGFERRYQEVNWVAFRNLGNRYRHGYDIVDDARVRDDLGGLIPRVESAVRQEIALASVDSPEQE
jgi:uncharacterized protein with HEPN domain